MAKYIRKSIPVLAKRTLSEFGEMVNEIAKKKGQAYSCVSVERTIRSDLSVVVEFKSYINGYGFITAGSVEECIQKTKEMCFVSNKINQEIIL